MPSVSDYWQLHFYAFVAATVAWGRMVYSERQRNPENRAVGSYAMASLTMYIKNEPSRRLVEMLLFALIGSFLGVGLSDAKNLQQAIAAGFGWTHLLRG